MEGNVPNFLQQPLEANTTLFTRYRNTATLVSLMLEGGYQCPHRTIDEYVEAFTGFTPADAKDRTEREPKLPSDFDFETKVSTLTFKKMSESSRFLCFDKFSQSQISFTVNR